jgi:biopolymer transport protein ExbD
MNFRPGPKNEIDLNITPLIDVVFLLLIFFMVSTTFDQTSEINIALPEASVEQTESTAETVTIAIDAQGKIYVENNPLVNAQLLTIREAIRDAMAGMADPTIVINADANATHQSVIRVMDAARQLSLKRISFTTQPDEEENAG